MKKFDKYNKRIKFIYASSVRNAFTCNAFYNVTYGNRGPSAYCQRWDVVTLLRSFHVYHTGRTYNFISHNKPNEAEVIRGLYLYLRWQYNHARNVLTKHNKQAICFQPDHDNLVAIVKQARKAMMLYKKQYEQLRDEGVYTYMELIK